MGHDPGLSIDCQEKMKEGINRDAGFLMVVYYYFYLNPGPPIYIQTTTSPSIWCFYIRTHITIFRNGKVLKVFKISLLFLAVKSSSCKRQFQRCAAVSTDTKTSCWNFLRTSYAPASKFPHKTPYRDTNRIQYKTKINAKKYVFLYTCLYSRKAKMFK